MHFIYVAFAVGGEILILLGGALRWGWVRGLPFRITHMASVLLVAVESIGGAGCPLTTWEYRLRGLAGQRTEEQISFIARLVRGIIFYDFSARVFLAAYVGFALFVGLTFLIVPPHRRSRDSARTENGGD